MTERMKKSAAEIHGTRMDTEYYNRAAALEGAPAGSEFKSWIAKHTGELHMSAKDAKAYFFMTKYGMPERTASTIADLLFDSEAAEKRGQAFDAAWNERYKDGRFETIAAESQLSDQVAKGWELHLAFKKGAEERVARYLYSCGLPFLLEEKTGSHFYGNRESGVTIYAGDRELATRIARFMSRAMEEVLVTSGDIERMNSDGRVESIPSGSGTDIELAPKVMGRLDISRTVVGADGGSGKYDRAGIATFTGFGGLPILASRRDEVDQLEEVFVREHTAEEEKKATQRLREIQEEARKELVRDLGPELVTSAAEPVTRAARSAVVPEKAAAKPVVPKTAGARAKEVAGSIKRGVATAAEKAKKGAVASAQLAREIAATARENTVKLVPPEDYSRYEVPQEPEPTEAAPKFSDAVRTSINHWWRREFRGEEIPVKEQHQESGIANFNLAIASGVAGIFGYRAAASAGAYVIQKIAIHGERERFKWAVGEQMGQHDAAVSPELAEKYGLKGATITPELSRAIRSAEAIEKRAAESKYLDPKRRQLMRERAAQIVQRVSAESGDVRAAALKEFYGLADTMVTTKVTASRVLKDTASAFLLLESAHVLRAGVHGIGALADRFQRKYTETKQERDFGQMKETARKTFIDGFKETYQGAFLSGHERTKAGKALAFGKAWSTIMVGYGLGKIAYGEYRSEKMETVAELKSAWTDLANRLSDEGAWRKTKNFFALAFQRQKEVWDGHFGHAAAPVDHVPSAHETGHVTIPMPTDHAEAPPIEGLPEVPVGLELPPSFAFAADTTADQVREHMRSLLPAFKADQAPIDISVEQHGADFAVLLHRTDGVAPDQTFLAGPSYALTSQAKSAIERLVHPVSGDIHLEDTKLPYEAKRYFELHGIKFSGSTLDLPNTDNDLAITDAQKIEFAPGGADGLTIRITDSGGYAHDVILQGGKDVRVTDLVDAQLHPLEDAYVLRDVPQEVVSDTPAERVIIPEPVPHEPFGIQTADGKIMRFETPEGAPVVVHWNGNTVEGYDVTGLDAGSAAAYVDPEKVTTWRQMSWLFRGSMRKDVLERGTEIARDDHALQSLELSGHGSGSVANAIRKHLIAQTDALTDKHGEAAVAPEFLRRVNEMRARVFEDVPVSMPQPPAEPPIPPSPE